MLQKIAISNKCCPFQKVQKSFLQCLSTKSAY